MERLHRAVTAMALLCPATAGTSADAPASFARSPSGWLQLHNQVRAQENVPPLEWDADLAAQAQAYAAVLARSGALRHSPKIARPGQGENLWMGTAGYYSPADMVGSWSKERRWFRAGIFPDVSSTGNWADVGHFTQMIWRATTHLGCATARYGRNEALVCRYARPGNVDGRPVG